jgi:hypothetical protein
MKFKNFLTNSSNDQNVEVNEAILINTPDGFQIRPSGGFGTWTEESLRIAIKRDFENLLKKIDDKNYKDIEHIVYKGTLETKIAALARFAEFMEKNGKKKIALNKEINLG